MNATEILNKAKELLSVEVKAEEVTVKLAQATLENGAIVESEEFAEGKEIFIVTEDEKVALPVGEYNLEDGKVLVVQEEGVIASIGDDKEEEEVEAVEEDLAEEEDKKELEYATKAELSEIREMVEEIKSMLEPKEEMSADELAKEATKDIVEEVKEELSVVEKVNHNPETEEKKNINLFSQKRAETTLDRVLAKITKN